MNAHNLDGLSDNDFHVVALENINVAMRAALGSKTKYSKSGNTIIFNNDCRWNDRADLSPYTSTAVVQADYAGLEYRDISREAIEDYRADLLASRPDLRDMLEREFAEIDAVFLRVEKEAQLREARERVRAEAEEQAAKRAAFAAQLGGFGSTALTIVSRLSTRRFRRSLVAVMRMDLLMFSTKRMATRLRVLMPRSMLLSAPHAKMIAPFASNTRRGLLSLRVTPAPLVWKLSDEFK